MAAESNQDSRQEHRSSAADPVLELQQEFLSEAAFLLEQCEESYLHLDCPGKRTEELARIFQLAHSIKGAGNAVGFAELAGFAHVVEDLLAHLRVHPEAVQADIISLLLRCGDQLKQRVEVLRSASPGAKPPSWDIKVLKTEIRQTLALLDKAGCGSQSPEELMAQETRTRLAAAAVPAPRAQVASSPASSSPPSQARKDAASVKVETDRIDSVLDLVGELVVIKSQLMHEEVVQSGMHLRLTSIVSLLDKTIRELQDQTLSMRLTSLRPLFLKTQRVVRDLSHKLGKQVDLLTSGEDTEIDRNMIELLGDPLMHMARNSLDHGIEPAESRVAAGKPPTGRLEISARQSGSRIILEVRDDGRGLDRARILKKAVEKNLVSSEAEGAKLTDREVFNWIFAPGFSTAESVSDVSGRGVGMDVVKSNIEKLKGSVEIDSQLGAGTVFRINIPLTAAISDGMMVQVQERRYILPTDQIRELVEVDSTGITRLSNGQEVVKVRDRLYPLVRLANLMVGHAQAESTEKDGVVLVAEAGSQSVAFMVDAVLGQIQVVLKPLGPCFDPADGVAGAAILGDGKVALVADLEQIVRRACLPGAQRGEAA